MEQFYERHFVDKDDTAFVVPADKTEMGFIIRMPACGAIPKLIVAQVASDAHKTAFKVDLCSQQTTDAYTEAGDLVAKPTDAPATAMTQIIPQQSANSGAAAAFFDPHGYGYRNQEGSATVPVNQIYLVITPTVTTYETNWEVSIAYRRDQ